MKLNEAIKRGDGDEVSRELDGDPNLVHQRNPGSPSPILLSVYYGHPEIAELFVRRGATPTLHESAAIGDVERVLEILRNEPLRLDEPGEDGHAPLGLAIYFGHNELARSLLEAGADVNHVSQNDQKVAPIHAAVSRNIVELIAQLIARGADINLAQGQGFTPLHGAAFNGSEKACRLLLNAGARRDAVTADGRTAAQIASERGHPELSVLLST